MIVLSRQAYDAILDHALEDRPREACGLLAGHRDGDRIVVESAHRARNAAAAPRTRFRIDPRAQLALMDGIEAAGRRVVGIYHSHPAGPHEPSSRDRRQANWPGYHYLLASLRGRWPTVNAWRWTGERFVPAPVRVREDDPAGDGGSTAGSRT
ncbi:MAG: desampylase [Halobacteriaceae archaeon]